MTISDCFVCKPVRMIQQYTLYDDSIIIVIALPVAYLTYIAFLLVTVLEIDKNEY